LIYIELSNYKAALKDFEFALGKDKSNGKYFANRGFCLGKIGKISEAMSDFAASEKLAPENHYLYKYRAEIYQKMKENDKACRDFREAQKLGLLIKSMPRDCKNP